MASNKLSFRMAVGCQGHFGPNLHFVIVNATIREYESGLHYEAAESYVSDKFNGEAPFWTVDHKDPAKKVLDICKDWSKVEEIDCGIILSKNN